MVASCTESGPIPKVEFSEMQQTDMQLDPSGDTETIRFTSVLDWYVEISPGGEWLAVTPMEGTPDKAKITVKADQNLTSAARTAQVFICSGDQKVSLRFSQEVYVPVFELIKDEYQVSALGGTVAVGVTADVKYTYEVSEPWIRPSGTKAPLTYNDVFVVDPNPVAEPRTAEIIFTHEDKVLKCTVTQRAAGTEADDWKYEEFVQRSLAMRFTADWCGYCPYMAAAFETAKSNQYGSLEIVSIHGDGGLVFSSAGSLMSRFGATGFPVGIVDTRAEVPNYSNPSLTAQTVVDVVKEYRTFSTAQTGIAINSSMVASELRVELTVYAKKPDTYRVTALLLEDNIIAYQNGVTDPASYIHNDVARMAITSINGDRIEIGEGGGIWTGNYSVSVPSKYNRNNLRILVYVEKPYVEGEQVCNVENVDYKNYGGRYLDNCRAVTIKTKNPVEFK